MQWGACSGVTTERSGRAPGLAWVCQSKPGGREGQLTFLPLTKVTITRGLRDQEGLSTAIQTGFIRNGEFISFN